MKKYTLKSIANMEVHDKPKHKLGKYGAEHLTDIELMSLIIGSGSKGHPLEKISSSVLKLIDNCSGVPLLADLTAISGIGESKAKMILAFMELNRRKLTPKHKKISAPSDVYPLLSHYGDREQEHFFCITLNGAHEVINTHTISVGILNRAIIHPREVFAPAIADRSASIIIAHNHPSGKLEPSKEDKDVTLRLTEAGSILGIEVLDHVVFSFKGYYSFLEEGEI